MIDGKSTSVPVVCSLGALLNGLGHACSHCLAKLTHCKTVEGKFEHDVREAQRQQNREAECIILEIESGRCPARRNDDRQPPPRHLVPMDHLGFDEPVKVVVGVYKREQAGEPRVEPQIRNAE